MVHRDLYKSRGTHLLSTRIPGATLVAMKLAVVIPMYNESKHIVACLDSLDAQSRRADEIVLIDNNSTDNTVKLAEKYDVTIISEPQQGIWAARSRGFDEAMDCCDVMAFTDADARFPADWLKKIDEEFKDGELQALTGPGIFYDGGKFVNWLGKVLYMQPYFIGVGLAMDMKPLFASNAAIRASTWKSVRDTVHRDDQKLHDDVDLSYHLQPITTIKYRADLITYISTRPFYSFRGMVKRYYIGFRSLFIHWNTQAPWHIYRQKFESKKTNT